LPHLNRPELLLCQWRGAAELPSAKSARKYFRKTSQNDSETGNTQ